MTSTTTLWRPTGQTELDLVAQSGWKKWPPRLPEQPIFYPVLHRAYATRITREWNVPAEGVGFVTRFDVATDFLQPYPVQKVGGKDILEYWIPADHLEQLNARIVGAIMKWAEYRGAIPTREIREAETALGRVLPAAWSGYLQQPSWLRKGWLSEDCFLWLFRPSESFGTAAAWPAQSLHPGIFLIGGSDTEHLAVDLRLENPPVVALPNVSRGWIDALPLTTDLAQFVTQLENGTLKF